MAAFAAAALARERRAGREVAAPVDALRGLVQLPRGLGLDRAHAEQHPGRRARPQARPIADLERALEFHIMTALADVGCAELRQLLGKDGGRADRRRRNPVADICRSRSEHIERAVIEGIGPALHLEIMPIELRMVGEITDQHFVKLRIELPRAGSPASAASSSSLCAVPSMAPAIENVHYLCAEGPALAQCHAAGKRPGLELQGCQGHPYAHGMQDQRLLADAGALAAAELVSEAGAGALLEAQDLGTQLARASDFAERLARILRRVKYPETSFELERLELIHWDDRRARSSPRQASG